ncbi:XRE family transcriptional regulator [Paenibacillus pinisoli]|uniref:XRE family transcriptional regulator n=1 Tax=Paenibacillus pinisoli TaxID=1276110 RepID=A0A3A6PGP2_9BACL|nr:helix-turn-helix transcriptional regulator [Paenibacillus pinisoli]RJX40962.1 XRE family transcriptional regulator [Paenibacillus pinisoli]
MRYVEMLNEAISKNNLSLSEITNRLEDMNVKIDRSYLSKLRSGNKPPASDRVNEALAQVLNVDPLKLKVAAYHEKIPSDVLEKL